MKSIRETFLLSFLALSRSTELRCTAASLNDFKTTVVPQKASYRVGETVNSTVTVTYTGTEVMWVDNIQDWKLVPEQKRVRIEAPSNWKRKAHNGVTSAIYIDGITTLEKGETMEASLDLSRYFSRIPAGTYDVPVSILIGIKLGKKVEPVWFHASVLLKVA